VKRHHDTFFVECDAKDTIESIKNSVAKMSKSSNLSFPSSMASVRLLVGSQKAGKSGSDPNAKYTILEDSISLVDANIVDDQILWMTFLDGLYFEVGLTNGRFVGRC
jgi:hypothetical protein